MNVGMQNHIHVMCLLNLNTLWFFTQQKLLYELCNGIYRMGYNAVWHLESTAKRGKAMHIFVCIVPVISFRVTTPFKEESSSVLGKQSDFLHVGLPKQ